MTGAVHGTAILEFPTYRITVREPLRDCVYQEVQDRQRAIEHAKAAPATPNLDWKVEFDKACTAFDTKAVLVLVGDRQPVSLDETITLTTGMEVAFLRLVPLVGGLSTLAHPHAGGGPRTPQAPSSAWPWLPAPAPSTCGN